MVLVATTVVVVIVMTLPQCSHPGTCMCEYRSRYLHRSGLMPEDATKTFNECTGMPPELGP